MRDHFWQEINTMATKKKASDGEKPGIMQPNDKEIPSDGQNVGRSGFTRSLAGDKSLEGFKNWINGMTLSLNPNAEETMTEEEWVESWKKFWSKDLSETQQQPREISVASVIEDVYPGVTQQIRQHKEAEWPACPRCGSSARTAKVSYAIMGRAITMAASTTRIKLSARPTPGNHYCNACEEFFDYFEPTALMSPKA
jgi:hypothetical protein